MSKTNDVVPNVNFSFENMDKLVHAFLHFVLTFFCFLFLRTKLNKKKQSTIAIYALSISFIYGVLIETFQTLFTSDRAGDVFDVCANTAGAFLAIYFFIFINKKTNLIKNKFY